MWLNRTFWLPSLWKKACFRTPPDKSPVGVVHDDERVVLGVEFGHEVFDSLQVNSYAFLWSVSGVI